MVLWRKKAQLEKKAQKTWLKDFLGTKLLNLPVLGTIVLLDSYRVGDSISAWDKS